METKTATQHDEIRAAIRSLCARFPEKYWQECDQALRYPSEFVAALTEGGWLSVLIPEEYGGAGLGTLEAGIILEEINRSGANAGACHAQMYTMGAVLRHGSEEQKQSLLPEIAAGRLRLQSFGVTESDAGSDTTSLTTFARRVDDRYVVTGRKMWISRVQHSDLIMLLCRTTPRDQVNKKTEGLTVLLVDMRQSTKGLDVRPIRTMINHETNELIIDGLEVPVENRIGEEGQGFRYILSGMNAERILVASDSLGDGYFFTDRATKYVNERVVFGRPIGANQGVQFPIAKAYINLEAARLMRDRVALLYDAGLQAGAEANMAKYLASEAAWEAANACMTAYGGYGMAVEYGIERKFREARLNIVAPVSNNLVLSHVGEHVLKMPRSY